MESNPETNQYNFVKQIKFCDLSKVKWFHIEERKEYMRAHTKACIIGCSDSFSEIPGSFSSEIKMMQHGADRSFVWKKKETL